MNSPMEKWYNFPIQTTRNIKFKTPRRLILHVLYELDFRVPPKQPHDSEHYKSL